MGRHPRDAYLTKVHHPLLQQVRERLLAESWYVASMTHMTPTVTGVAHGKALGSTWHVYLLGMPKHQVCARLVCTIRQRLLDDTWWLTSGHHMTPTVVVLPW